jgi:spermidine synthase
MHSDHNEELYVVLNDGRFQLCTPNAIYSFADKYDNFRESFQRLRLDDSGISKVLLLGFGLGSIPYMLEKTFGKKYTYTGVEIDDAVIYLASKYVLDELRSDIELVRADAYAYIMQTSVRYDMICIDIFVDDKIPDIFLTQDFLTAVQESLSSSGILLFNHLAHNDNDIKAAKNYFKTIFLKNFPQGNALNVSKNIIMLNDSAWIK